MQSRNNAICHRAFNLMNDSPFRRLFGHTIAHSTELHHRSSMKYSVRLDSIRSAPRFLLIAEIFTHFVCLRSIRHVSKHNGRSGKQRERQSELSNNNSLHTFFIRFILLPGNIYFVSQMRKIRLGSLIRELIQSRDHRIHSYGRTHTHDENA